MANDLVPVNDAQSITLHAISEGGDDAPHPPDVHPVDAAVDAFSAAKKLQRLKKNAVAVALKAVDEAKAHLSAADTEYAQATSDASVKLQALDDASDAAGLGKDAND